MSCSPHRPIRTLNPAERKRFFEKTQRDMETGCLVWIGAVSSSGYGTFDLEGGSYQAHRIAWTLSNGAIPEGIEPDHLCERARCVESTHLELVTEAVNTWRAKGHRWSVVYQPVLRRVMTHPHPLVTRSEAQRLVGLSEAAVRRAIRTQELSESDQFRAGRHRPAALISRDDLACFVLRRAYEDAGLPVLEALIAQANLKEAS